MKKNYLHSRKFVSWTNLFRLTKLISIQNFLEFSRQNRYIIFFLRFREFLRVCFHFSLLFDIFFYYHFIECKQLLIQIQWKVVNDSIWFILIEFLTVQHFQKQRHNKKSNICALSFLLLISLNYKCRRWIFVFW